MSKRYISQLKDNEKVSEVFLVSDKQMRTNKNGNYYLQFNLADKTGMICGRLWNVTDAAFYDFQNGDYVNAEGATQRYQGVLQFIAKNLTKIDPVSIDTAEFVRFQSIDVQKAQNRLKELLRTITHPALQVLAESFLIDDVYLDLFSKAPAGIKLHHAYPGGLLEHTLQMMEMSIRAAELYPVLNRDLLLMGAFLHDAGKTRELAFTSEMFYTDEGQMLGHSYLGTEILNTKIAEAEKLSGEVFDTETAMLLKHLLISHHGEYDNQAAKLPMTLEAQTLHFIDSIDSKIAEYQKYIMEDPNLGGHWTDYLKGIDRKLYKKGITG
ncbi:MAG: HD domain-containing protein [Planctomycetaceae bacterium]|jgi:3'-5' exoribonuclease|nr:HD domain-containing protein [Planctomycetaceae bacterium]